MTATTRGGIRPASVTVQLYADGTASGAPVDLDAANSGATTRPNLPCEESKQDGH